MSESGLRGRWLWSQLLTPDPAEAVRFYAAVFGWKRETYEGAGEPYRYWSVADEPIAGLFEKPKGSKGPPCWLGFLGTTDVERTVERAVGLGARLLREPGEVPTVGRFAVLADPCGALFAVYRPTSGQAPPVEAPSLGTFSWHELATDDVDAAFAFYGELFAWKPGAVREIDGFGTYTLYERTGAPRGGIFRRPESTPACSWLHYVRVSGLAGAAKRVGAAGGALTRRPFEVPGGDLVAICTDPAGAPFALHEVRPR